MGSRRQGYRRVVIGCLLLLMSAGAAGTARPTAAAPAQAPQLRGGFAAFWAAHEGALLFGQPLTDEMIVSPTLTVQWFERARLEWHPDWPPGQQISLGRLGAEALAGKTLPGVAPFPSNPDHRYFPQTGHSIQGEILRFWQDHGGVAIFGYPLSEEQTADGKTVQYFERARLEWHPELAGTGYGVLPAPLGALLAGPSAAPAVVLEPPTLQAGRTLLVKVPASSGSHVTGTFAGHPLAFTCCLPLTTPAGSLQAAWALAGIDPDLSLPPEPLTVRISDAQGRVSTAARTVSTVAYPYPVLRLPAYPYSQPRPSTGTAVNEHDLLRTLVAPVSGPPRWQGRWQPPLAGPLVVNSAFGERLAYGAEPVSVIHGGVDLDAQAGDPIFAPAPGRVVLEQTLVERGNVIVLDHGGGVYSLYAHQSAFRARLGEEVQTGDVIGFIGSTGLATGPHLHWEVYVDDSLVEPLQWLARSFP